MKPEIIRVIKLTEANFCLNCEVITDWKNVCPICAEKQLWPLRNWLENVIRGKKLEVQKN